MGSCNHRPPLAMILGIGIALAGCDSEESTPLEPTGPEPFAPSALRGAVAFVSSCAPCHSSRDGFDLALFAFTDTTIVRRAVKHVDTATALDIVAHIRSLDVKPLSRHVRPFQPGGVVVADDRAFAISLFGFDGFPGDMTTERMRAIDPLQVRAAVGLPLWSIEENNLDWMPDSALTDAILDDQGGLARAALAGYYAAPTEPNLVRAVVALRIASRRGENPGAPCLLEMPERADFNQCFQVQRWISTLSAQHMLRRGITSPIHFALHDVWWDVGNVARKSLVENGIPLENALPNWASWMYLGWIFAPGRHASVYTGNGLRRLGLVRHATFVAVRSMVARPRGSPAPYADVQNAAAFAPETWTFHVTRFGYQHLLGRIAAGDLPPENTRVEARQQVANAYTIAARKVTPQERQILAALRDQVLAGLP